MNAAVSDLAHAYRDSCCLDTAVVGMTVQLLMCLLGLGGRSIVDKIG